MNSRIDMEKVDYSQGADILKELYDGKRQVAESKWEDFFNIPLTEGYANNKEREFDFNSLLNKDLSNNNITITIKEIDESSDKW